MQSMSIHQDDIDAYIKQWYIDQKGKNAPDQFTVLYPNISIFHWFKDHPLIWQKGQNGEIVGADLSKIESYFRLEQVSKKQRLSMFEQFKHIERGAFEELRRD